MCTHWIRCTHLGNEPGFQGSLSGCLEEFEQQPVSAFRASVLLSGSVGTSPVWGGGRGSQRALR